MATNDKYDRQLRLWGANGQRALMSSHVLLINATVVGTETLKNLVLPGIKNFTILDHELVNAVDTGSNFFVESNSVGLPRAEVVTAMLQEMNPDVCGFARIANLSSVLLTEPGFFQQFNLVIASNVADPHLTQLCTVCNAYGVPIVVGRSCGLVGYVRLQVSGHEVIESRPESEVPDLRLSRPFPALLALADRCDLASLDSLEHSHVPYPIILIKALQLWKIQHGETSPRTSAEKEVFCNIVRSLSRDINKEENFVEAIRESHRVYASVTVSEDTSALLATQRGQILQPTSSAFSFLLRALELFLNSRGVPPLVGALPDMTSTTSMYTDLQQVYREQALTDRRAIAEYLMTTMRDAGCSGTTADPTAFLAQHEESIDLFCRNCARNLRMLTTRSVAEERQMLREGVLDEATEDAYEDPAQTPIGFYLALRSAETFFSRYQRQPGICASVDFEKDVDEVWKEMNVIVNRALDSSSNSQMEGEMFVNCISPLHAREICRYGGAETHVIGAILGGVASQEAVKLLTHQYVCINNTFVYNGVAGVGAVYEF